jgi:uncharacterized membrane protein
LGKKRKNRKPALEKPPSRDEPLAREKPAGRKKNNGQLVLKKRERSNLPLTALAGAGMVLTAYLALTSWLGQPPLYCDDGSSCDIVQQSRWGTFLGLPTAFWGFLTYATLAYIGFRVRHPVRHWKSAWIVSLVGLGYSVYLTIISLLVIDATCVYCFVSLSIMAAIFGVIISQRSDGLPNFKYATWTGQTMAMALVIIGGMHLHYSGAFGLAMGTEDPYLRGLAEYLSRKKAVLYGASW